MERIGWDLRKEMTSDWIGLDWNGMDGMGLKSICKQEGKGGFENTVKSFFPESENNIGKEKVRKTPSLARHGVVARRRLVLVDTKYRCSKKKPSMVVPCVVDDRELLKQRGKRERGLQQKRHEYGKFRLMVVVVVVIGN